MSELQNHSNSNSSSSESESNPNPEVPEVSVEDQITELELSLDKLKQRYQQIQTDTAKKEELIDRKVEVEEQLKQNNKTDSLKTELNLIKKELTDIEFRLESELFKWSQLSEPFWQAVRFLGIGLVIGWFLRS